MHLVSKFYLTLCVLLSSPDDDYDYYEYEYEDDYFTSDDPALVVKDDFTNKRCTDFRADGFRSV